jgi:hypothetical protein
MLRNDVRSGWPRLLPVGPTPLLRSINTGYDDAGLDRWAKAAHDWEKGAIPEGLPTLAPAAKAGNASRDVFIYLISGAKVRNPAGAMALQARIDHD